MIFDKSLGDLFVVRVAGNVAGISQIGTIEFAVQRLGARLIIVLGHTECGAVRAAFDEVEHPSEHLSPGLSSIIGAIRPLVEVLSDSDRRPDNRESVESVVRANIRAVTAQLQRESQILDAFMQEEGLEVIGAEYSLETGVVDFFEDREAE
jgi:carbonic anhydrase